MCGPRKPDDPGPGSNDDRSATTQLPEDASTDRSLSSDDAHETYPAPVPLHAAVDDAPDVDTIVRSHLAGVIEAVLFANEQPMTAADIAKVAGADWRLVRSVLLELKAFYKNRGVNIDEIGGGYTFRTAPAFAPFARTVTNQKPVKLTRVQLETLAVVAYRQPVTRPEVDEIRGVDSGAVLRLLLERGMLRILGKKDEPGRPLLYGTSKEFLRVFSLKSLRDLPSLREFAELTDESRRTFERILGESAPEQLSWETDEGRLRRQDEPPMDPSEPSSDKS